MNIEGLAGKESIDMAVIGSKLVARKFLEIASERGLPIDRLDVLATPNSAGQTVEFGDREITVGLVEDADWSDYDIVYSAAPADFALEHGGDIGREAGVFVDSSSGWRKDSRVPIIIPSVNPYAIEHAELGIIAKPNCTTTIGAIALKPLDQQAILKSLDVSTYQSSSGQGQPGLDEHDKVARELMARKDELVHGQRTPWPAPAIFPVLSAFNSAPVAGVFEDSSDHTTEELKYKNETRKIFGFYPEELPIDVTCARSGQYNCHGLVIHAEFEDELTAARAHELLDGAPSIQLHEQEDIPEPIYVAGSDDVHVGRVRQSERFGKRGLLLYALGDNLRPGAATNGADIVELLIQK